MNITIVPPLLPPVLYQYHGSKWWIVMSAHYIRIIIDGVEHVLYIPMGFRFDRATIWWQGFITKDHLGCIGPLVHDVLCHYKGNIPDTPIVLEAINTANITPWRRFTRPEVDNIFYAVMLADKIVPWRAWVARQAVRLSKNWEVYRG